MKILAAALAFGVELEALWSYGTWGLQVPVIMPLQIAIGLASALAMAVLWGLFLAPQAGRRLPVMAQAASKIGIFTGASILAWSGGGTIFAAVIAVSASINLILDYLAIRR